MCAFYHVYVSLSLCIYIYIYMYVQFFYQYIFIYMCILEKLTVKTDLDSQFLFIKFNDNKESVLMAKMFASW